MEKLKYESPKFEFQEMKLMESVADTCWGYGEGWYDGDGDKIQDPDEPTINFSGLDMPSDANGKCNAVAQALVTYVGNAYGKIITTQDVGENSHSVLIRPIKS